MECLMACIKGAFTAIGGEIVKPIFAPIKQYLCCFFYDSNIENLQNETMNLSRIMVEAEMFIEDVGRGLKTPVPRVTNWHVEAEQLNRNISQFLENITEGSSEGGQTPWSRYSLSSQAFKMTEEVTRILGRAPPLGDLAYNVPFPNIGSSFNLEGVKDFDSRRSLKNNILNALRAEGSNMISICGMAGMGKTTLAKEIVRIVEREKLFDLVAFTTVSREPDVNKIQSDIISCFGWKIENNCNTDERARKLHHKFMESDKSSLLIFDDVWREMDDEYFEKIGLPSPSVIKRSKIILTSRDEGVCNRMRSKENFPIGVLSDEDACGFFKEMASVGSSFDNRDLHQTARQILGELGGSPIAIVTVAKALKNRGERTWNDALLQLKNANPDGIEEMDRAVYSPIKLSYNLLRPKEAQSCLLLCSLFPEDFNIPIEVLVWYAMGLRLFKNVGNLQQARNRVHVLIDKLRESFLLLDGDSSETFKMHDLVRDIALTIASKEEHSYLVRHEAEMRLPATNGYKDAKAISLLYEDTLERPVHLWCPKLELMRCKGKNYYQNLPNNFFEGMKELKVLQLSSIRALPESLKGLEQLRTLICDSFQNIQILGDLGNLEILAISTWRYKELSKEIGLLRNLRLLCLDEAHDLEYFPSGILPALKRLEELYVSHSFNRWKHAVSDDDKRINASLCELEDLPITTLQICVPKPSFLPTRTTLASLKRFNIRIGSAGKLYTSGDIYKPSVNKLYIKGDTSDAEDGGWYNALSMTIEDLTLKEVDDKYISGSREIEPQGFLNLRKIDIKSCRKLKFVFPLSVATRLSQLQSICIESCYEMEGMFYGKKVDDKIEFPKLICLHLYDLPKLIGLWTDMDNGGHRFLPNRFNDHDAATNLSSTCCKVVSKSDIAEEASTSYIVNQTSFNHVLLPSTWKQFSNLHCFKLVRCDQLEVAFPPNVAEQMVQLKTLEVMNCRQMQYIIGNGRSQEEKNTTLVFSNLVRFYCEGLPELVDFCVDSNHVFLDCHSLEIITIINCPKIKALMLSEVINEGPSTLNTSVPDEVSHINSSTLPMDKFARKTQPYVSSQDRQIVPDFNIQKLHIENCNNLIYLFSPRVAKLMVKLKEIYIENCEKMEGIVAKEDEKAPKSTLDTSIVFRQLREIMLIGLPNLRSFYGGIYAMEFPLLKSIDFSSCKQMKTFSFGSSLSTPILKEITVEKRKYSTLKESLNTIVNKVMEETIEVHDMEHVERIRDDLLPYGNLSKCLFLDIERCGKLLNAIPYNLIAKFQNLKELQVAGCHSLEEIFEYEGGSAATFSHLDKIHLEYLPSLKHILNKIPKEISGFQKLRILEVSNCSALRNVFSVSVAKNLLQLQDLVLIGCKKLKEVVAKEDEEEEATSTHKIVFPHLRLLCIKQSWHLECFYSGIHALEFPLLATLILANSDSLKNFSNGLVSTPKLKKAAMDYGEDLVNGDLNAIVNGWFIKKRVERIRIHYEKHVERIGDDLLPDGDLRKCLFLDIEVCGRLLNAIPCNLIAKFQNLKELQVADCRSLEEIFEYEGGSVVTFSHLEQIVLKDLPSLKHILNNIPKEIGGFQKLRILKVSNCSALRNVFSVSVAKNLLQLQELVLIGCKRLKEVVAEEHEEEAGTSTHQIVFPTLEFPLLKTLILADSDLLENFSNGLVRTPKLEKVTICGVEHTVNGDLNATISEWFIKKMEETIKVHHMEHVERIGLDLLPDRDLSKCRLLDIERCGKLLNAIPCNSMANFQNLEKLHVAYCDSLEEIFEYGGGSAVTFSHLEEIVLKVLRSLKHIFNKIPKEIGGFQKLRILKVYDCYALKNLFSVPVAKNLLQLQELVLIGCERLKEVVAKEDEEEEATSTHQIVFPQLSFLQIKWSRDFECFYSGIHALEFPLLKTLILPDSDRLKNFSNGKIRTPKLTEVTIGRVENKVNRDLNATTRGWFIKKMVETIRIHDMEHVERIGDDLLPDGDLRKCLFLDIKGCGRLLNAIPCNLIAKFQNLKELQVAHCHSLEEIFEYEGGSPLTFSHLEQIVLEDLPSLKHIFNNIPKEIGGFQELRILKVYRCSALRNVFSVTFSHLEQIVLEDLPSLKHIFNNIPKEIGGFQELRILKVYRCSALRNVFSVSLARGLRQLRELVLGGWPELKEVVAKEDNEEGGGIVFPQLSLIEIRSSLHFECFYSGIHTLEFPLLETLILPYSNRLKNFSNGLVSTPELEKVTIDDGEHTVNGNLNAIISGWFINKEKIRIRDMKHAVRIGDDLLPDGDLSKCLFLDIEDCDKLLNAIPHNLIANFQNLKELHVAGCDSLEEIFEYEGGSAVPFSHLEQVVLKNLPSLKHILNNIPKEIAGFRKLKILKVSSCSALRNVFSVSVARGLLQLQELELWDCDRLKEVVAKEEGKEEEEETSTRQIVFPLLRLLQIEWSWSFECFYSGIHALEFPLLETLILPDSDRLKNFSNGLVSTPKLEEVTIDYREYPVNGDLNATVNGWFINKKPETEEDEEEEYEKTETEEDEEEETEEDEEEIAIMYDSESKTEEDGKRDTEQTDTAT